MRAGLLTRRLALEEPVATQNATGEEIITWTLLSEVWATIEPIRGREALLAGAALAIMDTKIRIRWSPDVDVITEKWRARYRDTIYNIVSVVHIRIGRREIELLCRSGSNEG